MRELTQRVRVLSQRSFLAIAAAAAALLLMASAGESRGRGNGVPQARVGAPAFPPKSAADAAVEQTSQGTRPAPTLVASFDGLGVGFEGPHGPSPGRNPSDNSLAVGPDHIVQTVNSPLAIFTKKGRKYDTTGRVLYGAVPTNTVFAGFGGTCEARNNGDAVVRYDQLANRWLIVMPIFRRSAVRPDQPAAWTPGDTAYLSPPGVPGQPGPAAKLFVPPAAQPQDPAPNAGRGAVPGQRGQPPPEAQGWYVGDYYKKDATNYSTRIGAFRMPGCAPG